MQNREVSGGRGAGGAGPAELADNPLAWPNPDLVAFDGVEDDGLRTAAEEAALFVDVVVAEMYGRGWRTATGAPSASALARASGVNDATVSRVLRGRSWPDFRTFVRLSRALDLGWSWTRVEPAAPAPAPERVASAAAGQATKLVPSSTADPARQQRQAPPRRPPRPTPARPSNPYAGLNNNQRRLVALLVRSGKGWAEFTDGWRRHGLTLEDLDDLDVIDCQRRSNRDLDRLIADTVRQSGVMDGG